MKKKQTGRATRGHGKPVLPSLPAARNDAFFWRQEVEDVPQGDFEDIMLRRVDRSVAHRFRGAAGARGLTHAQYLAALVALHDTARQKADSGDERLKAILGQLGLSTVSI